ncbi:hypothetical protein GGE24_005197 [Bradyrhizobium centrosematis]|nr:hypothetical protein [Bradyrhizobium centrosematis]MCS3775858.1 hypothetical protein [Bradyrhizobium centrosematis]
MGVRPVFEKCLSSFAILPSAFLRRREHFGSQSPIEAKYRAVILKPSTAPKMLWAKI